MTMCATSPQEQPTTSLGARFDLNQLTPEQSRALWTLNDQLLEYGPVDCQINDAEFRQIETTVAHLISLRANPSTSYIAVKNKAVPVREPLAKVLNWCEQCPVRTACLAAMSTLNYTGIAGGVILRNSEPYSYAKSGRRGRPRTHPFTGKSIGDDPESEITDGLW